MAKIFYFIPSNQKDKLTFREVTDIMDADKTKYEVSDLSNTKVKQALIALNRYSKNDLPMILYINTLTNTKIARSLKESCNHKNIDNFIKRYINV